MSREPDLLLASKSPRRALLLEQIGVSYQRVGTGVIEVRQGSEAPETYVRRLSLEKARSGRASSAGGSTCPVLGADTAVVVDDDILGKPASHDEALAMLSRLSGRVHRVLTAVALVDELRESCRIQESLVRFRRLSARELRRYAASEEPFDKAGAYAVQGYAAIFIERLEGSFSGVMGLPLFETWQLLVEFGIDGSLPGPSLKGAKQYE